MLKDFLFVEDPSRFHMQALIREPYYTYEYKKVADLLNEMRQKEYVSEIKDVLMGHLKEINTKYRMPLLEIMESGLQYEKTRGNMKESVIEKVEKLFEEDSEE